MDASAARKTKETSVVFLTRPHLVAVTFVPFVPSLFPGYWQITSSYTRTELEESGPCKDNKACNCPSDGGPVYV